MHRQCMKRALFRNSPANYQQNNFKLSVRTYLIPILPKGRFLLPQHPIDHTIVILSLIKDHLYHQTQLITPLSSWAEPVLSAVEGSKDWSLPALSLVYPEPVEGKSRSPIVTTKPNWSQHCHPELVEGLSWACPEPSLPWACRREGSKSHRYHQTQLITPLSPWACRRAELSLSWAQSKGRRAEPRLP